MIKVNEILCGSLPASFVQVVLLNQRILIILIMYVKLHKYVSPYFNLSCFPVTAQKYLRSVSKQNWEDNIWVSKVT